MGWPQSYREPTPPDARGGGPGPQPMVAPPALRLMEAKGPNDCPTAPLALIALLKQMPSRESGSVSHTPPPANMQKLLKARRSVRSFPDPCRQPGGTGQPGGATLLCPCLTPKPCPPLGLCNSNPLQEKPVKHKKTTLDETPGQARRAPPHH